MTPDREWRGSSFEAARFELDEREKAEWWLQREIMEITSAMLLKLPNEDAWITAGEAQYLISAQWVGEHDIVSKCGWWMGRVNIVEIESVRYVEWLQASSPKFEDE